jgi:polar amino acid transport system ATP-binding protein
VTLVPYGASSAGRRADRVPPLVAADLYELTEKQVVTQRRDVGMVFQHFNLFPHMTVLDNIIEAPTKVKGEPRADATKYAMELLDRVGLTAKANAYPSFKT